MFPSLRYPRRWLFDWPVICSSKPVSKLNPSCVSRQHPIREQALRSNPSKSRTWTHQRHSKGLWEEADTLTNSDILETQRSTDVPRRLFSAYLFLRASAPWCRLQSAWISQLCARLLHFLLLLAANTLLSETSSHINKTEWSPNRHWAVNDFRGIRGGAFLLLAK